MEDAAPPPGSPADYLVMIVDDDSEMRMLMEMRIQKEGFKTVCGTDGRRRGVFHFPSLT